MFQFSGPSMLDIGNQNIKKATEMLKAEGIPLVAAELGGHQGRTATLHIANGTVTVRKETTHELLACLGRRALKHAA